MSFSPDEMRATQARMVTIRRSPEYTNWTLERDAELTRLWGNHSMTAIAEIMGLTPPRVRRRARRLNLPPARLARLYEPTKQDWIDIATEKALALGINKVKLLAGARTRPYTEARWRAWRDLLARHPHVSLAGAARVSGFHHASIISGLRRLEALGIG